MLTCVNCMRGAFRSISVMLGSASAILNSASLLTTAMCKAPCRQAQIAFAQLRGKAGHEAYLAHKVDKIDDSDSAARLNLPSEEKQPLGLAGQP